MRRVVILIAMATLCGTSIISSGQEILAKDAQQAASLAEVDQSGGLTPRGPAHAEFVIFADGKYTFASESTPLVRGALDSAELKKIRDEIKKADLSKWTMTSGGIPPSAADGTDTTISLWTNGHKQTFKLWQMKNPDKEPLIHLLLDINQKCRTRATI